MYAKYEGTFGKCMYSTRSYLIFDNSVSTLDLLPPSYPFEAEARLNNICKFSPNRKENTTLHHYKDQLVNAVYSENHTKHINTKCRIIYC
jgi:hypothetical protein